MGQRLILTSLIDVVLYSYNVITFGGEMVKLNYESGQKPLWSQLFDILSSKILDGTYQEGDSLPGDRLLMETYDVSRVTVRQAMDKLMNEGLIIRQRGKGTRVLKKRDLLGTTFVSSFKGVEEKNQTKDRRVISVSKEVPPVDVAYFFGLDRHACVLKLVRYTYVDQKVAVYYETYLNPIVSFSETADFSTSLYQKLEEVGYPINRVQETITASLMNAKEKKLFGVSQVEALMNRCRRGYCGDYPIEYTYSKYVAKDYQLNIDSK